MAYVQQPHQTKQMNTDTNNCPYCGAKPYSDDDGYSCGTEIVPEWGTARTGICYETQIFQQTNEVARLRELLNRAVESPAPERQLPKQDRTPPRLDAEIEVIDDPSIYSVTEARHATADAIRYLRAEIEALKKNQK